MAKKYYCSNCGKQLGIRLQAVPKFSDIVRLVEYHECGPNDDYEFPPEEFKDRKFVQTEGHDEFVSKINDLSGVSTETLRDQRFVPEPRKELPTGAPAGLKEAVEHMGASTPENPMVEEPIGDSPTGNDDWNMPESEGPESEE